MAETSGDRGDSKTYGDDILHDKTEVCEDTKANLGTAITGNRIGGEIAAQERLPLIDTADDPLSKIDAVIIQNYYRCSEEDTIDPGVHEGGKWQRANMYKRNDGRFAFLCPFRKVTGKYLCPLVSDDGEIVMFEYLYIQKSFEQLCERERWLRYVARYGLVDSETA